MFDYTLYIKAFSPQTIPMARLAEYMTAFAELLGHKGEVHFQGLRPGSTQVVATVEREAAPKVQNHLDSLTYGTPEPDQMKAFNRIDDLLSDDNASGTLIHGDAADAGATILKFPGATRPRPSAIGPIRQEGTLDGILVSVGGSDKTVHLRLQNGEIRYSGLDTDRATARELARHLFEPVRVKGTGTWTRDRDGNWLLNRFRVSGFEVLKSGTIWEALSEMRGTGGNEWGTIDDPIGEAQKMRLENGPH